MRPGEERREAVEWEEVEQAAADRVIAHLTPEDPQFHLDPDGYQRRRCGMQTERSAVS